MRFLLPGICFLALLALILGLINPSWVIRWGNKRTRFHVIFTYGLTTLLVLVIMDISTMVSFKTSLPTLNPSPSGSQAQPLELVQNSNLASVLKHSEFYRETPVELIGSVQGMSQHANITKVQMLTPEPNPQKLILVLPDSTLDLKEGDRILVKGNLGIKLSDEQAGKSYEAPSILAQSIDKV